MKTIPLKLLSSRNYDVLIGEGLLTKTGALLKSRNLGKDVFIVTDRKVASFYLKKVIKSLEESGFASSASVAVPEGEKSKSREKFLFLVDKLHRFDKNLAKDIIVVCLGGGVAGDVGGFVAGTYLRGVNYVSIPTTLLSQVDSCLGGKVGVNLKNAKNLMGMFYQPRLVIIDPLVLRTLGKREVRSGLAEVIKYGIIREPFILRLLERNVKDVVSLKNMELIERLIYSSLKIKAEIVAKDERDEKDVRIALNLGHTVGHALEAATGYKKFTHGEAVSVGILAAFSISAKLGILKDAGLAARTAVLLKNIGLPVKIEHCSPAALFKSMQYDKKFKGGENRFVLPVRAGETKIVKGVPKSLIREVIRQLC